MKPTVGLTSFFLKMNLCEKNRVPINVHAGFVLNKNSDFFEVEKKLFVLQEKRVIFLPNDPFFDPLFRDELETCSEMHEHQQLTEDDFCEADTNFTNLPEFLG